MLQVPVVGIIQKGDDGDDEVKIWEAYQAMFAPSPYDPQEALVNARTVLPKELHEDQYYLPLALIFSNVPALFDCWPRYFKPGNVNIPGLKKNIFGYLSSGELFIATLALHLFNDCNRLPKDGLLGLRNLDSYHYELAIHAIQIFTKGVR